MSFVSGRPHRDDPVDGPPSGAHTVKPSQPWPEPSRGEVVNHPQHYGGDTTYEAIKVIRAWGMNFSLGNAVKYICRAGKKGNAVEDLKKAAWYINEEIQHREKESKQ